MKRHLAHSCNRDGKVRTRVPHLFPHEYVDEGICVPAVWDSFHKIVVVRNPWDRAVSAYKHWSDRGLLYTFPDFLEVLVKGTWSPFHRHGEPQWKFAKMMNEIVRYENLNDRFPGITRSNASSDQRDYREFYDKKARQIVEAAYAKDIDRFEYRFE